MKGIYKLTFPNGKVYIGQSNNLKQRQKEHKQFHKTQKYLQKACEKFNYNYTFTILKKCIYQEQLNYFERIYIHKYNSIYPNGYNIEAGNSDTWYYIADIILETNPKQLYINIKEEIKHLSTIVTTCKNFNNLYIINCRNTIMSAIIRYINNTQDINKLNEFSDITIYYPEVVKTLKKLYISEKQKQVLEQKLETQQKLINKLLAERNSNQSSTKITL